MTGPLARFALVYPFQRFQPPSMSMVVGQVNPRVLITNDPSTGQPWAMYASIQPLQPMALVAMPDALRNRSLVDVFTDVLLTPTDEVKQFYGDRFAWSGYIYEVVSRADWESTELCHYKFTAARIPNK